MVKCDKWGIEVIDPSNHMTNGHPFDRGGGEYVLGLSSNHHQTQKLAHSSANGSFMKSSSCRNDSGYRIHL